MNTKNILIIIAVILSALTFIGCIGVDNDFREVKSLVINSTNEKFYKDVEFSVGSVGISFARMIASFNDDDEDAQAILKNIYRFYFYKFVYLLLAFCVFYVYLS